MDKLYPPSIQGTLPSFYKSAIGTTVLAVPFSMNKTVSIGNISGFSLRIKTTNTDILYGVMESQIWSLDIANPVVTFAFTPAYQDSNGNIKNYEKILDKLTIGSFYKVQLAYIDKSGVTGYYSTVATIKYTAQPSVEISGFAIDRTNNNSQYYVGIYKNLNDVSEKAYKYCFNLYTRDGVLLESSGWNFHNSYEDTSLTTSIDKYTLNYAMKQNSLYKIEYIVVTNNGLEIHSPQYLVMEAESIDPEVSAQLIAELDYENACVELGLVGETAPDGTERIITGAFLLSRASSLDNYGSWLPISTFRMTGQKPSSFLLKDYTIMQGVTYIYSLQQFNDYEVYSNRILSEYVEAQFEDIFLFDGQRQLKVRFNPKITSFKTTVQENKKNTLGGRYPFVFRSGHTYYKEFPISGLISYLMDDNESFVSKAKELYITEWKPTTNITDENVLLERLFKLKVMEWLNDGRPKLFKSPQEGNYIVRLMNVSLSPNDTVSRMLHTFSCQAVEIADYTPDNLLTYKLLETEDVPEYQMRWTTVVFQNVIKERNRLLAEAEQNYRNGVYDEREYQRRVKKINNNYQIYNVDLLKGQKVYHLKMQDMIMGTTFTYYDHTQTPQSLMIGATGAYEAYFEQPISNLYIANVNNTSNNINRSLLTGSVTYGFRTASQNRFDIITEVISFNIPIYQKFGPNDNVLKDYSNLKRQVTRINYARFTRLDVQEVYSPLFGTQIGNVIMTGQVVELDKDAIYDILEYDDRGYPVHNYYHYYDGVLYAYPHFIGNYRIPVVMYSNVIYKDPETADYYCITSNGFTKVTDKVKVSNNNYSLKNTDLNVYTVYLKKAVNNQGQYEEKYYKYDGANLIELEDYSTMVYFGDIEIDVAETKVRLIEDIDQIPEVIKIGSGVTAEIGVQVKIMNYKVEESTECEVEREDYEFALEEYHRISLGLEPADKSALTYTDTYKLWNGYTFENLVLDQETMILYREGGKKEDVILYVNRKDENGDFITPSRAEINEAYAELEKCQKRYFTILDELLIAQEGVNTYE